MADGTLVKEIAALAQKATGQTVTIDGTEYSTVPLHDPRKRIEEPDTLVVHTLTGLVAYAKANRDELNLDECVLHVVGPDRVDLVSRLTGEFNQRFTLASARLYNRLSGAGAFGFGQWLDTESMIIAIQALFEDTVDRQAVLKLLGNLKDEVVKTRRDDGVTQEVTVRDGLSMVEMTEVPNPVVLAPFRTFEDVAQPDSPFVFRLRKDPREGIVSALFEADGGAWRSRAVELIALFLRQEAPDALEVIA